MIPMRPTNAPLVPTALPRPTAVFGGLVVLAAFLAGCGPSGEASVAARTLDTPPDLQVGEWWTVEVDPELVGAIYPSTMVVTERAGGRATLGIPADQFSHDFLVIHIPPLGDLDLGTFAWRVMWDDFEALRFPLEVGRSWSADFHGRDVEAEVTAVEGNRAHVTMTGEGQRIDLIYDADWGMITDFREEALGLAFRVTDHGFDYHGEVLSLSGIQLGLMETAAGVAAHHAAATGVPAGGSGSAGSDATSRPLTTRVDVGTGASHGSLGLILWNVGFEDAPGSYGITATAPDGTTFQERFEITRGGASVDLGSFGHDAVDGTWELEFDRDGPAGLLVELFTYDLTRVMLEGPGGR
jgi:hypothetical protein